jgi:trigger factor
VKVTAERIPESKVLLRIEIPPDQVEKAIEKTYRDLSQRVRVPGFRPGRAPRPIVERYLGGADIVQKEGIDRLIDDSYRQALRETDTRPVGDPDLAERPEFHPGEPLVIEATVPVSPRVELGDYQSIRMQPVAVEATYEMVNRFVDDLLEANATLDTVDRPARDHDVVTIDVVGTAGTVPTLYGPTGEALLQSAGGQEVYNVKGHEHSLNVEAAGPVEFAAGFDEEVIGMTAGSEKRFGLTLPADYPDAALANQSVVFDVKVHDVKEKHLPALDDAFAQKVGGGNTVEELRESVRQRIQNRLEREARSLYENSLVEAAVSRSTIEIPDVMVEEQIDLQIEDLKSDLAAQKISWQDYLKLSTTTDEQVRADMRDSAIRTLRGYLALREIARREGIQVTPADVSAEIDATAEQFGQARAVVRERLSTREQRNRIESRLFFSRAIQRLSEIAQQPSPPSEAAEASEGAEATAPSIGDAEAAVPEEPAGGADLGGAAGDGEAATSEETSTHG